MPDPPLWFQTLWTWPCVGSGLGNAGPSATLRLEPSYLPASDCVVIPPDRGGSLDAGCVGHGQPHAGKGCGRGLGALLRYWQRPAGTVGKPMALPAHASGPAHFGPTSPQPHREMLGKGRTPRRTWPPINASAVERRARDAGGAIPDGFQPTGRAWLLGAASRGEAPEQGADPLGRLMSKTEARLSCAEVIIRIVRPWLVPARTPIIRRWFVVPRRAIAHAAPPNLFGLNGVGAWQNIARAGGVAEGHRIHLTKIIKRAPAEDAASKANLRMTSSS